MASGKEGEMLFLTILIVIIGVIALTAVEDRKGEAHRLPLVAGGIALIASTIMAYYAGISGIAINEGIEYTFIAKIDEEVIVYQSYESYSEPQNRRKVRIITKEILSPGIQPGDTVVLTDDGIKKVLPREEKSSTR